MNNKHEKYQLWRVDLIHLNGYYAPYHLIEVETNTNKNEYKTAQNGCRFKS